MAAPQKRTPVVDLGRFQDPEHHQQELANAVKGFLDWGFVEFVNHGIPDQVFDTSFKAQQEFFSLPSEEKAKSTITLEDVAVVYQPGYKGDITTTDGVRRLKEHFHYINIRKPAGAGETTPKPIQKMQGQFQLPQNLWPEKPENFREAVENMENALAAVVDDVLYDVFSECLGLTPSYIRDHFVPKNTISKRPTFLHHYLQSNNSTVDAAPPHEDGSVFTIVVQANLGIDGLQVLKDDEWVTISPNKYSLIVNSGDVMKVWSNGDFKSMTHRVTNNKLGDRDTIAYFIIPSPELTVQPIQERLPAGVEPRYKAFTSKALGDTKTLPDAKNVQRYEVRA